MSLAEQISTDLKNAMKSGDRLRLETLRSLRAGLLEKQIELLEKSQEYRCCPPAPEVDD